MRSRRGGSGRQRYRHPVQNVIRRARDSIRWRTLPADLRAVDYLWYNAQKKLDLRQLPEFAALAREVRSEGRTLLREDRLYTLWQGVEHAGDGAVVEVGVFRGGGSAFLARSLRRLGKQNPVVAYDTFEGHVVVDLEEDGEQRVGQFAETSYESVAEYLRPLGVEVVKGNFLEVTELPSRVAFAHIDVDVYRVTAHCLATFADRMAPGAWIVVDDYGFTSCPGAHKAVEEFIAQRSDFARLHHTSGQAVLIRTA